METHKRSITKSILWRIMGIVILALITYIFTRSWIITGLITFFHHFAFIFIYYFHERTWLHFPNFTGKKRKILRVFIYEIILGHCVLGIINLIFIGSWSAVTLITIAYIENKLWIYVVYDWLWNKISWEQRV